MLFSNGNGTRLLIEILSAVDREVCSLTKGRVICLTAVSSASYECSHPTDTFMHNLSPSWIFLSPRWHPPPFVSRKPQKQMEYLVRSLSSPFWTHPAPKSSSIFFFFLNRERSWREHKMKMRINQSFPHVVRFCKTGYINIQARLNKLVE